jgi:hypothetical protein
MTHRIALDEKMFRALVRGEVVRATDRHGETVEVALSDIGWARMAQALQDAMVAAR